MKTIRFNFFLSLFLFISIPSIYAQSAVSTAPETSGVSLERLARYDDFLNKEVKEGHIAGAISYIMRKNQVVHKAAYGYSDIENRSPMKEDQIMHIMSMTKPIISVAFMMLYEEGHFFLTDPVSKYLPQFKNLKVAKDVSEGVEGATEPANSEVTIAQVLTHTAGFSHGLTNTKLDQEIRKALYFEPHKNIEARIDKLVELPMVSQPGEQWYYSTSPDILSVLIAHFSGMNTAEFLEERIFEPLGMKDTGYNIELADQNRWMPVHNINEEGKLVNSKNQLPLEGTTVYSGAFGLFSTAADYMTFCQMLLNKGELKGKRFLSRKTIDLMTTNHV
ncbi:MAG: serine hydrolase domain-containing protein, partial [Bacteroidota bacterium]